MWVNNLHRSINKGLFEQQQLLTVVLGWLRHRGERLAILDTKAAQRLFSPHSPVTLLLVQHAGDAEEGKGMDPACQQPTATQVKVNVHRTKATGQGLANCSLQATRSGQLASVNTVSQEEGPRTQFVQSVDAFTAHAEVSRHHGQCGLQSQNTGRRPCSEERYRP